MCKVNREEVEDLGKESREEVGELDKEIDRKMDRCIRTIR